MNDQHTAIVADRRAGQSPALSDDDRKVLASIDDALARTRQLKAWWEDIDAADGYTNRFKLMRTFNESNTSFGYFDSAPVGDGMMEVMGSVEDSFFDQAKSSDVGRFHSELREFVLRYLMRASDFKLPTAFAEPTDVRSPPFLRSLSLCLDPKAEIEGFGYQQSFYKRRDTGEIGAFSADEQCCIVDLREIGTTYEWIVVKVEIFDFSFKIGGRGGDSPQLVVPLPESSYLVLSPDFLVNEEDEGRRENGSRVLGRYGIGYAFVRNPTPSTLAYGPGDFDVAFQLIDFRILETGEVRARLIFAANRPTQIVNVPLAPVDWGLALTDRLSFGVTSPLTAPMRRLASRLPIRIGRFDPVLSLIGIANLATGGLADRGWCISKETLEKQFLVKHSDQHYQMVSGALVTWRTVANWLDESAIPDWVREGVGR